MTDFHTHILPGIDDGAKSADEAQAMLQKLALQRVNKVILTSHFYAEKESPTHFCQRRNSAYQALTGTVDMADLPQVALGAEVLYFEGMSDCEELEKLKIEGTRLILVEMPFESWSPRMINEVASIFDKRNLIPLVAHIDRYVKMFNKRSVLNAFEDMPVLIQANAEFFTNRKTARLAHSMLKKGKIHLLGSDCHNTTTRKPDLKSAYDSIEKNLGRQAVKNIEEFENAVFNHDNEILLSYMFS